MTPTPADGADLTRRTGHELADRPPRRRLQRSRAGRRPPGRGGTGQPRPQRLADDRARARPWPRPTSPTPGWPRPVATGRRRAAALPALLGLPVALKDLVSVAGGQCTAGLADPRGLPGTVRRPHHRAPADRRGGHPGQDQHGRVRHGQLDRALRLRSDGKSVGPRPSAGRLERRLGRGGRRVQRAVRDRHRHRRLDPPAGGAVRDRRA